MTETRRRGSALLELLVTLPLLALTSALAVGWLLRSAAVARQALRDHAGARELRDARRVLEAELAPLVGADLVQWSDSVIEFSSHLGVGQLCTADSSALVIAPPPGDVAGTWVRGLRAGDRVRWFEEAESVTAPPVRREGLLLAPPIAVGPVACAAGSGTRRWRLPVSGSPTAMRGAPVIATRPVQYLHYRSNGRWWLGRRAWTGTSWEVVQPVAGPIASPAQRGMRVEARSANGDPTGDREAIADLRVVLTLPPIVPVLSAGPSPGDSVVARIVLRGDAWTRGRP